MDGPTVGEILGAEVGAIDGDGVGDGEGDSVGANDGATLGAGVGEFVGEGVGDAVGFLVKQCLCILNNVGFGSFNITVNLYSFPIIKPSLSMSNVIICMSVTVFMVIFVFLCIMLNLLTFKLPSLLSNIENCAPLFGLLISNINDCFGIPFVSL